MSSPSVFTVLPAADCPTTVDSQLSSTPFQQLTQLGRVIQPWSGPNRKHRSSVDVSGVISRVPLQGHCPPSAGPRGSTAYRNSPIVA
jgi:hypothetical protein